MNATTTIPLGKNVAGQRFCRLELSGAHIEAVRCRAAGAIVLWRFDRFVALYFPEGAPEGPHEIEVEHSRSAKPTPLRTPRWFGHVLQPPEPMPISFREDFAPEVGARLGQAPPRKALAAALSDMERQSLRIPVEEDELARMINAARMFREFDRYTHEAFGDGQVFILPRRANFSLDVSTVNFTNEYGFRHSVIRWTMADLFRRAQVRCLSPQSETRVVEQPKIFEPWIAYLSALQLLFYRRWYDGLTAVQDWERIFEAFVWFGSGALTFRFSAENRYDKLVSPLLSQGAPDGTPIVLFAEFAIAAAQTDTHARAWTQLLPGLISMVRAYGLTYCRGDVLLGPTSRIERLDPNTRARLVNEAVADLKTIRATRSHDELCRALETLVKKFSDMLSDLFPRGLAMTGDRAALADPNRATP